MSDLDLSPEEMERFARLHNALDRRYIDEEVSDNDNAWRSMSWDDIINDHLDEASDGAGSRPVWIAAAHLYNMYDYNQDHFTDERLEEIKNGDFSDISVRERRVLAGIVEWNMSTYNNNSMGMGQALTKLWGASPEQLASFAYLSDLHSNTKWSLNATWNTAWLNIVDPVNLIPVAGKAAAKGGQKVFQKALSKIVQHARHTRIGSLAAKFVTKEGAETIAKKAVQEGTEEAVDQTVKASVKQSTQKASEEAIAKALQTFSTDTIEHHAAREFTEQATKTVAKEVAEDVVADSTKKGVIKGATDFLVKTSPATLPIVPDVAGRAYTEYEISKDMAEVTAHVAEHFDKVREDAGADIGGGGHKNTPRDKSTSPPTSAFGQFAASNKTLMSVFGVAAGAATLFDGFIQKLGILTAAVTGITMAFNYFASQNNAIAQNYKTRLNPPLNIPGIDKVEPAHSPAPAPQTPLAPAIP